MLHRFSDHLARTYGGNGLRLIAVLLVAALALPLVSLTQAAAGPLANDFSIQLTAQNTFWVDANKCSVEGPQAAWLSFWITNTSGSSQSDVTVVLSGLNGTTTPKIVAAPDRERDLGVVPAGAIEAVYFYVDYSDVCNYNQGGGNPYSGYTDTYQVTVYVGGVSNTVGPLSTVTTDELITATAAGVVTSELLIPDTGVWVGMILDQLVTYSFNNNRDLFFQPAAEADLNPCLRLVNVKPEYVDPGITGIPMATDNRLWYPNADVNPSQTDLGNIQVRYQWEVLCYFEPNNPETISPWAAAKSGQPYKYQIIGAPMTIQPPQPSLTAVKLAPICVPEASPQYEFSIVFTNTTGQPAVPVYLKRIEDYFSDTCVKMTTAFGATGPSLVNVTQDNTRAWPGSGSSSSSGNPFTWTSKYNGFGSNNSNINVKGWPIASATGSNTLTLKFTADFSGCSLTPQRYTNNARGILGQALTGEVQVQALPVSIIYPCIPTAVTLADFSAVQQGDGVLLTWETNSELNNRGFNLYRGTSEAGPDRQLNEALIPSQSQGNPGGFVYTWIDRADLVPGTTYFYWVEDVSTSGVATMHGPVSVDFTVPTAITVSSLEATPAAGTALPLAATVLALLAPLVGALAVRRRRA